MVIGYCSVFVYIHIHMYVCGYEPRQANAVLRQSKKDGERGRAACFINSAACGCLALNFLLLFGGSCEEILPAAEEADLAPSVASAAARFAGELYGREQHLALGFLGRMLS